MQVFLTITAKITLARNSCQGFYLPELKKLPAWGINQGLNN
jgi:hypothetical protein